MELFPDLIFLVLLFLVAVLYSSVGHGGASGYLALMGLFHFAPDVMRPSALLLNIIVALVAWWQYASKEKLNVKLFVWLIAGSIPFSFAGATISLDSSVYKQVLGVLLLFQCIRLLGFFPPARGETREPKRVLALVIGSAIGLVSGLIGIGGGIILSPLLLMLRWTDMKQTALISALFIFLNSTAGLTGLMTKGVNMEPVLYIWIGVAFAGGLIGSRIGSRVLSQDILRKVLGMVLLIAGIKLIFIQS